MRLLAAWLVAASLGLSCSDPEPAPDPRPDEGLPAHVGEPVMVAPDQAPPPPPPFAPRVENDARTAPAVDAGAAQEEPPADR